MNNTLSSSFRATFTAPQQYGTLTSDTQRSPTDICKSGTYYQSPQTRSPFRNPESNFIGEPARTATQPQSRFLSGPSRYADPSDPATLLTSSETDLLSLVDREGHEQKLRKKVLDDLPADVLSERYLLYYTIACPRCGIRVQRDADSGGCPSVRCVCGEHFRCEIADF